MNRLLLFLIGLLWVAGVSAQPLAARLERLLNESVLRASEVGIAVYDLTAQQPVFTYQDKKLYRPASIEKLITGITALSELGPDYMLSTSLYYKGTVTDSTLLGDLYVVGAFDSEFGEPEMDRLVRRVKQQGIKRMEGRLIGDVSLTDSLYYGDGWSWNDAIYDFQPCLSPLMFCKGAVQVTVIPSPTDSIAEVSVSPVSNYYTLVNRSCCHRPGAGPLRITRNWMEQGNRLLVTGNVASRVIKRMSLHSSQDFFMHVFAERLCEQGIEVDSLYEFGELPSDADSLIRVASVSHSLMDVLTRALKKSDNLSAEAMLRHVALCGKKTSHVAASDGVEVIGKLIRRLGYDPKEYCIVDGSGVSLYNYISPDLLLAFLKYAYTHSDIYASLCEALPIAGVDGTLTYRMRGTSAHKKVRAKTGTVTGVSSLAGFAQTPDNHVLGFVIINQNVLKAREARAFQDKVCVELCK